MKKIRIGNDIKIIWSIKTKDGQDYILDGKNLTVKAFRILGAVSTPISFETFENTLTCWFYGKDQTKLGVYGLVLVENEGREDMHTVDSCDAFQLVARSCDVDGAECGCGNVEVESVELTSTLSADVFSHGVPAGGSAGQLLSKKSDNNFDTEWVDVPTPSVKIEVDATMSETSTNPVQNKTIKSYVDKAIEGVEANQIEVEDVVSLPNSPMKGGRLILVWSNENAEILQPVSYDSSQDIFESITIPKWVTTEGVDACFNYTDSCLSSPASNYAKKIFHPVGNGAESYSKITKIDETHFKATKSSAADATIDCNLFFFTQSPFAHIDTLLDFNSGNKGIHRYIVEIDNSGVVDCGYDRIWFNCHDSLITGSATAYNRKLGKDYLGPVILAHTKIIIEVDYDNVLMRTCSLNGDAIISNSARNGFTLFNSGEMASNKWYRPELYSVAASRTKIYIVLSQGALKQSTCIRITEIFD